ncbi:selenoprotein N-like isoform X2 [Palaemon carinicauda]|uniref:selenoprotein N-like isoform X2 n=1 Tax=Palaemon carinicauda TaxID=392227 RepID=UPI0035B5CE95
MSISQLNSEDGTSELAKSEGETEAYETTYQNMKEDRSTKENIETQTTVCKSQFYLAVFSVAVGIVCLWFQGRPYEPQIGISSQSSEYNVVTLKTYFVPLDPNAFMSFIDSKESKSSLHGILNWKSACVSWKWVHHQYFVPLLPPGGISKSPEYVWRLLPDVTSPDVMYRYGPRGASGIVRATSLDCMDIFFRLHAEYQLNPPSRRPLWFTPAAFIGRLVMNITDMTVKHFSLGVPKDKPLNVDLEWLIGSDEDKDMEVTITYLPEMSLEIENTNIDDLNWLHEIPQTKALDLLEKDMYKYKQVDYFNFSEAYLKGSNEGKPVHTLVLWGSLVDQSC